MFPFLGSLISGGASLLGSFMQQDAIAEQNELNRIAQAQANAANLAQAAGINAQSQANFGSQMDFAREQYAAQRGDIDFNRTNMERNALRNIDLAREFAQQGVRWRVNDALAAGLHPLYALGASTVSAPAISVGGDVGSGVGSPGIPGGSMANVSPHIASGAGSVGAGFARMGQDLGRAIAAVSTEDERMTNAVLKSQALERGDLENQLLAANVAKVKQQIGPPFPSGAVNMTSQGDSAASRLIAEKPSEVTPVVPGSEGVEPGLNPDIKWSRDNYGRYFVGMSKQVQESIEDSPYQWAHIFRNGLLPIMGMRTVEPFKAPPGHKWTGDPLSGMELKAIPRRQLLPSNRWFNVEY